MTARDLRAWRCWLIRVCAQLPGVDTWRSRRRSGQAIDAGDIALVNGWAAKPPPVERLTLGADGRLAAAGVAQTAAALLALVARDAVELLTGPLRDRIRECEGHGCTVLFVDASRGGRRRWCSMDVCGARSKMAAYRRRRQTDAM